MIQTLPKTVGLEPATVVQLDGLRKQRNNIDYSGELVSQKMTDACLHHAGQLLQRVQDWLTANRPELL